MNDATSLFYDAIGSAGAKPREVIEAGKFHRPRRDVIADWNRHRHLPQCPCLRLTYWGGLRESGNHLAYSTLFLLVIVLIFVVGAGTFTKRVSETVNIATFEPDLGENRVDQWSLAAIAQRTVNELIGQVRGVPI